MTSTRIDVHAHDDVTAKVISPGGPGKFNLHLDFPKLGITIYFDTPDDLLTFDEEVHGKIEDALFRHVHGVSDEVAEIGALGERVVGSLEPPFDILSREGA